jgi:hypothetical protein
MNFPARVMIAVLAGLLLFACRGKTDIPGSPVAISADSLIPEEKMVLILADVHVAEAAFLLERNEGLDSEENPESIYQGTFKKYRISRTRYDQNLAFYRQDTEKFAKMYEKIIGVLESHQTTFKLSK